MVNYATKSQQTYCEKSSDRVIRGVGANLIPTLAMLVYC